MAITNKKTLEKMKKKNPKSIVVNKDKSITQGGKTYKNKEDYKKNKPAKSKKGIWDWLKGDRYKKKAPASNVDSGRGGKDSARQKIYDKKSMFAKAADNRDKAKTTPGKARPFKEAFDAATEAGKERFLWKGKSFLTTKGKRSERFPVTTDKKSAATPKKSLREKITGFKTQKGFEDAKEIRVIKKRIAKMKERKNQGKSYSAKNLAELEAKLK